MKKTLFKALAATILFSIPNIYYSQAPNLGIASTFAAFTALGAFSNVNTTSITGDIGTDFGILSGFPPGMVVGSVHTEDAVSAQAALDVDTAYSFLLALPCGPMIGSLLGNGQVLTPDVYCLGAASTIDGELILDGLGDFNSVFVFKVDGALSTASLSEITLINGATICNVYWQVNGQFETGVSSIFKGTVVASGAINLVLNTNLQGRTLSREGAITIDSSTVEACTQVFFPVTLVSFDAQLSYSENAVDLQWETASESNSDYFLIERSVDGIDFYTIGKQNAAGNSTEPRFYEFSDESPVEGTNFFRLNQFDLDASQEFSPVVEFIFSETDGAADIYPNPFAASVKILIRNFSPIDQCEFMIFNFLGEKVMEVAIREELTVIETNTLPSGIYFYYLVRNNAIYQHGNLVSQQAFF